MVPQCLFGWLMRLLSHACNAYMHSGVVYIPFLKQWWIQEAQGSMKRWSAGIIVAAQRGLDHMVPYIRSSTTN